MNLELVGHTDKDIDVVYKWKISDKKYEYYTCLPAGYGTIMIRMFIEYIFGINNGFINKIYATTADNNEASKKVLVKNDFKVDGRNREHYWIGNDRYDQLIYSCGGFNTPTLCVGGVDSLLQNEWKNKAK